MTTPAPDGQAAQAGAQPAAQQPSAPATAPASASGEMVEKARLDGALQKIQELTLANRALNDQIAERDREIGRLTGEIKQKGTEWEAKQSELSTQLSAYETEKQQLSAEVQKSQLEKLKIKLIGEAGKPQLFSVLDVIQGGDEASIKASIEKLGAFAETISKSREAELLAGVTHVNANPATQEAPLPTSEEGWQSYINSLPLGSKERDAAFAKWHSQIFQTQ